MKKFILLILLSGLSLSIQATRPGGSWLNTCTITHDHRADASPSMVLDVNCINGIGYQPQIIQNSLPLQDWFNNFSTTYSNCKGYLIKDVVGRPTC